MSVVPCLGIVFKVPCPSLTIPLFCHFNQTAAAVRPFPVSTPLPPPFHQSISIPASLSWGTNSISLCLI